VPRWPLPIEKIPMKIITCNMPQHYISVLDSVVRKGITPSRSEAIRLAMSHGLEILEQMILKQEVLIRKNKTSSTNHTPKDKVFVEIGDGKFQQYRIIGEA